MADPTALQLPACTHSSGRALPGLSARVAPGLLPQGTGSLAGTLAVRGQLRCATRRGQLQGWSTARLSCSAGATDRLASIEADEAQPRWRDWVVRVIIAVNRC